MLTPLQLNMIKFEVTKRDKAEIRRQGADNVIKYYLNLYNVPHTRKNYNSVKIILNNM